MSFAFQNASGSQTYATIAGNRASTLSAHSETYTAQSSIPQGSYTLKGTFYAGANESGIAVATVSTPVTLTANGSLLGPNGAALGTIAFAGVVKSVVIAPNQTVSAGATLQLVVTAYDVNSDPLAITPGSFDFSVVSGSSFVSVTPDGIATGVATGSASITASVDGVTSSPVTVSVPAPPANAFRFTRTTDSIQLTGGALNGACPLGTQFTIEAIVRPTTGNGNIWLQWADGSMDQRFGVNSSIFQIVTFDTFFNAGSTLPLNQWSHVAWCYDGTNFNLYQNGTLTSSVPGTQGDIATAVGQACSLGYNGAPYAAGTNISFEGDLAGFRISNNLRYTGSSFTPPTLPLKSDSSTLMLIDPYSSTTTPTTFAAGGLQGITATLGGGGGNITSPSWVTYTP